MNRERIKKFVGGQAVIEGVMMRGPGYTATAVREPAGTIVVQKEATVTCGCGNTFKTGSVKEDLRVDVCSKCHPFFTGQQRAAQARGRIEQFNKRYGK